MTHDELIAETGMALCENALGGKRCPCREAGTFACADEYPGQQARAAIRVIAPVVERETLDRALAEVRMREGPTQGYESPVRWQRRLTQDAIRALKPEYEG